MLQKIKNATSINPHLVIDFADPKEIRDCSATVRYTDVSKTAEGSRSTRGYTGERTILSAG